MPTVALHTLGCKLNHAETSTIARQFADRGYAVVDGDRPADHFVDHFVDHGAHGGVDVVVINTCTVTERADRECRQLIRRALRSSTAPYVIVTGCYAQLEPERIASIEGVNLVLGSREKFDCFRYAGTFDPSGAPEVHVSDISTTDDFGPAQTGGTGEQTRAYLKVQDGCDYSCSFCTIPLARGGSRSQSIEASIAQARSLVAVGFREIILTGVNVGDYGRKEGTSLLELVRGLERVEGLDRLRISSIEPNLLTDDLIDRAASGTNLCDHFHIPLQSGCDEVLRAMRRRYTTADFAARVAAVRRRIPDAGIGVDVIVGFPGETEAQFEETHRFLSELPASYLHVFTYSERANTPAALMGSPVPVEVRRRRNEKLRILGQKKRHAFAGGMVGKNVEVLTESAVDGGRRHGFTTNYVRVALPAETCEPNALVRAEILAADEPACPGRRTEGSGGR